MRPELLMDLRSEGILLVDSHTNRANIGCQHIATKQVYEVGRYVTPSVVPPVWTAL